MSRQRHHTSEQRAAARESVVYELAVLRAACTAFSDSARDRSDAYAGSILLDSALLHARTLYEFLSGERARDRVVAKDFAGDSWIWTGSPFMLECIQNVQHFRTHLTWQRVSRQWTWADKLPQMRSELESACEGYVRALEATQQEAWAGLAMSSDGQQVDC